MRSEDRTLAAIMWLLCIPFPFLAPFLFMLFSQNKPLVFNSSLHALGFSFFITILYVVVWVLAFVTFGLGGFLFLVPALLHFLIPILGAISAASGRLFEPLVSGPVVKNLMRR